MGTDGCLQKEFTRSNMLKQLLTVPPSQVKRPELNQMQVGDVMTQQIHPDHDRNEGCEFSANAEQKSLRSVVTSFREALKVPQMQSPEKSMRVFMQVALYQSIITSINSFSLVFPSIGTSLKVRSNQDRLIGTRKFSV